MDKNVIWPHCYFNEPSWSSRTICLRKRSSWTLNCCSFVISWSSLDVALVCCKTENLNVLEWKEDHWLFVYFHRQCVSNYLKLLNWILQILCGTGLFKLKLLQNLLGCLQSLTALLDFLWSKPRVDLLDNEFCIPLPSESYGIQAMRKNSIGLILSNEKLGIKSPTFH